MLIFKLIYILEIIWKFYLSRATIVIVQICAKTGNNISVLNIQTQELANKTLKQTVLSRARNEPYRARNKPCCLKNNCFIPKGNLSVQKVHDTLCKIRPKTTKKANRNLQWACNLHIRLNWPFRLDEDDKVNLLLDCYIIITIY